MFFLLLGLIPVFGFPQMTDGFSDGNFTENPPWCGDVTHFEINSSLQLHLRSSGTDTSLLFTPNGCIRDTEWNFWMKLSFNTSTNNYARIYLTSDTFNLQTARGYFIQAGGTDDTISILRQEGLTVEKLYSLKMYRMNHSTNTLYFKIKRDVPGNWTVQIDTACGNNYFTDGHFFDNTLDTSRWFGVYCRYTSSNSTKFYFDNFYVGPILYDTVAPTVKALEAINNQKIRITFSEQIFPEGITNNNHFKMLQSNQFPDSVIQDSQQPARVDLVFPNPLHEGQLETLLIQGVKDMSGNMISDTLVSVSYYRVKAHDILIHEILADPEPIVGLPDGEFVELWNRAPFPINLEGWSFKFSSYMKVFPSIVIQPNATLLIVKDSSYLKYGNCVFLFTSSSSLSNSGTTLILKDPDQHIIHSVPYSPEWFRVPFKSDGGWSLEMIDPLNPCGCDKNWDGSKHNLGGTPGEPNSIYTENPDQVDPSITRALLLDSNHLRVFFSETIDTLSVTDSNCWKIEPGVFHQNRMLFSDPSYQSVVLHFSGTIFSKQIYFLKTECPVKDCAGNESDTSKSVRFSWPVATEERDVIINELLSDPVSGGSRFVELYNRSEKVIDLKTLVLSFGGVEQGIPLEATPLSNEGYLMFPGDHLAFTVSPRNILGDYNSPFPDGIIMVPDLPVFDEDSGTIMLARKEDLALIDVVHYQKEMHYPLLITREGVSLERLNPDRSSEDKTNWHSAAENVGYATPAYLNSHGSGSLIDEEEIKVTPEIFSPDNDGLNDIVNIEFSIHETNITGTVSVYDSRGRRIVVLANNVLLSSREIFSWNGMTVERQKAPMGYYIIIAEMIKPDGTVIRKKATTFLSGRL